MKTFNYLIITLAIAITTTSCKKEITGSGNFISQSRTTSPFTEITSCGDFNVVVIEDSIAGIELHGEDNILSEIETEVNNGELKIYYKNCNFNYDHSGVTITIYNPLFNEIELQGSGKIYSNDTLNTSNMKVNLSGSGNIDLVINCSSLTNKISGSGKINLFGIADYANHTISGSGRINAYGTQSKIVYAKISGSGSCKVNATDELHATISGSGQITYTGNPIVSTDISGSGSVGHE